ncbi:cytidylyltransferase domain-containing protein [Devosia sp. Root635]|uniref:acylneuraminate cytidylyltransferase family protein n=1 Tax=Devosia sp. Root635 TaxID=1736575 RepID=UPI0006FE19B3|nr:acylneuraminate cytidylyltransferase family protein [Devosia sp. Root635]KRA55355.1 flagellar modification protein B [Devosia sp. Root635]
MTTIATICARGGSTGVPGKNIRLLAGRPLIAHTIAQALDCGQIDAVYVSTDSEAIAEVARQAGAHVPYLRPAELATSTAPKVPVIQHLVAKIEESGVAVSCIVDLDPTSPLRTTEDITNCLALYDSETDIVITAFESEKSPYFNMVERRPDGTVGLVKPPGIEIFGRQGAPKVYSMNASIYVWRPSALARGIWNNRIKMYEMPRERSIDIDSELDFFFVERLMEFRDNG